MKKHLLYLIIFGVLFSASFVWAAPTSTLFSTLITLTQTIVSSTNAVFTNSTSTNFRFTNATGTSIDAQNITLNGVSIRSFTTSTFSTWLAVGTTTAPSGNQTLLVNRHIAFTGPRPTLGACGSSPSIVGNDNVATVTIGSGIVTACTVNFAQNFVNPPVCTVAINSVAVTADVSTVTTSSVEFDFSASVGDGTLQMQCFDYL